MEGFKNNTKMKCFKEGGSVKYESRKEHKEEMSADIKQDKAIVKKAIGMHDKQEHKGEKTDLSKLKKGGRAKKELGTARKFIKPAAAPSGAKGGPNKYKVGGTVTNVYEAKKKSGDLDAIKAVKAIKPGKAAAPSKAAIVPKNTPALFKKGGKTKKMQAGGAVSDNERSIINKLTGPSAAGPAAKAPSAATGQGTISNYERNRMSNISKLDPAQQAEFAKQQAEATAKYGKKKGGKVKKFAEGGSTGSFTPEEESWLGGADRTDPFILARMRSALGDKKPALSAPVAAPVKSAYQAPNVEQDSGLAYPQENELRTSPMAPRRPAPMAAGPSADERLRMKNTRPYAAPNVEQDSGLDYPVKPGFFTATPGQQATSFNRGVQARKNFGKRFSFGAPSSLDTQLAAINKPKV
jgi:hypothetical protein